MGVRERVEPVDSPLYVRGELDQPGEVVPRGLVQVLCRSDASATDRHGERPSRAGGLARLARESADRPRDGQPGLAAPVRPRARRHARQLRRRRPAARATRSCSTPWPSRFMDDGWSVKRLIRRIVLSRAYRLASTHDAKNFEADPDNTLVWRMSKKRLEAEAMRDAVLSVERPADPRAARRLGRGPGGRGARRADSAGSTRTVGHASVGLPAGGPRPGARVARPLRLRRPEPRDRRARIDDDRPGPGALLHEQPVRDPPGRGRRPIACGPSGQSDDTRVNAAYLRFLSRTPTAAEAIRARAFLAQFRRTEGRPATASAPPGRPSARPSSPAPSSATSTDRATAHLLS